jgi:hypothetical protein
MSLAGVAGCHPGDERRELLGRLDGMRPAVRDDRLRDAAGLGLLAEATQEGRELALVEGGQQLAGRDAAAGVEAHVQRAAGPEAEPALAVGQLEARQAEVEQEAVDGLEPGVRGDRRKLAEVRLPQHQAVAESRPQAGVDPGDGRPIGVEPEEAAIRRRRLQDPLGVPTAAEGRVDLEAARSRSEGRQDLRRHHGQVPFLHLSSTHRSADPERTLEAHVVRPQMPRPVRCWARTFGSSSSLR